VDRFGACFFAFSERWTVPARGILHFPSAGPFQRVGFRLSRALELSSAWVSAFSEWGTSPAREISRFPSEGPLLRVSFCNSRAGGLRCRVGLDIFRLMELSTAWDSTFSERERDIVPEIERLPCAGQRASVGLCGVRATKCSG